MHQNYTHRASTSFADREDGTFFTDHDVRAAPRPEGLRERRPRVDAVLGRRRADRGHHGAAHRPGAHGHASRDVLDAGRAGGSRRKDRTLLRVDLGRGPHAAPRFLWNAKMRFGKTFTAYQLAKRLGAQARPRGDVQARGRGCLADRPRDATSTSTAGSTSSRRLEREPAAGRPATAARVLRLLPGPPGPRPAREHQAEQRVDPHHQLGPRDLRRVPLRRLARDRQGAVRGRGRGEVAQEGDPARVRARPRGRSTRTSASSARRRRTSCRSPRVRISTCPGRPFRALADGRVHRGADLQLDLHRRAAREGGVRRGAPGRVEPLRRAARDAPAHLPDARRAARDRQRRASSTSST